MFKLRNKNIQFYSVCASRCNIYTA